jgi:hypothetical protein
VRGNWFEVNDLNNSAAKHTLLDDNIVNNKRVFEHSYHHNNCYWTRQNVLFCRWERYWITFYSNHVVYSMDSRYELHHDKTNIMGLRPAWIQTSLRISAVWSWSMLFANSFSTCIRVGKWIAWILIRLRWCSGWFGSMLDANPLCWFCHGVALIIKSPYVFNVAKH